MKNIFLLPTDKPSKLCIDNSCDELNYSEKEGLNSKHITNQCMYITNDEEIKEGDWYASFILDENTKWETTKLDCVVKADLNKTNEYLIEPFSKYCKKIILTTDPTLIADGVQSIDDEFLEWFVKNPSCESVSIKKIANGVSNHKLTYVNRIIIPQEEPKQEKEEEYFKHLEKDKKEFAEEWEEIRQEFGFGKKDTLEEAVRIHLDKNKYSSPLTYAKLGAKWQSERMYSEQIELINWLQQSLTAKKFYSTDAEDLIEQFKQEIDKL